MQYYGVIDSKGDHPDNCEFRSKGDHQTTPPAYSCKIGIQLPSYNVNSWTILRLQTKIL